MIPGAPVPRWPGRRLAGGIAASVTGTLAAAIALMLAAAMAMAQPGRPPFWGTVWQLRSVDGAGVADRYTAVFTRDAGLPGLRGAGRVQVAGPCFEYPAAATARASGAFFFVMPFYSRDPFYGCDGPVPGLGYGGAIHSVNRWQIAGGRLILSEDGRARLVFGVAGADGSDGSDGSDGAGRISP